MMPVPITLPTLCAHRVGPQFVARIVGAGDTALLDETDFIINYDIKYRMGGAGEEEE